MKRLVTLGALELSDGETPLLSHRRKELALLSFVAREAPEPVSRARLATLLWSDRGEARARQSLRQALTELKRALPASLDVSATDIRLAPGTLSLDASEFERAVREERFADALELWRGDFLVEVAELGASDYRDWIAAQRATLRALLASACEALMRQAQAAGDWREAIARAHWWCDQLPGDPRARAGLAECLELVGRPSEAASLRGEAPPPIAHGGFTPDLVGREAAFSTLATAWQAALCGEARVVVVEGDQGVGKTRLLEEFSRFARTRAPDTAARALIVVDDAPALDLPARQRVTARLEQPAPGTLLLLAGTSAALASASFASLLRSPAAQRVWLDSLSPTETMQALRAVGRLDGTELRLLARRLHGDTGGNPGLMAQSLSVLAAEGLLVTGGDGRWALAHGFPLGQLTLPDGVRERIRGRLERATARTRRLVEATAVLGGPQSPAAIAATCGLAHDAFAQCLDEALQRRLLRLWSGPEHRYEFFGEPVRLAVYDLIPAARRRRLHRAAARALTSLFPGDPDARRAAREHRRRTGLILRWRLVAAAAVSVAGLAWSRRAARIPGRT